MSQKIRFRRGAKAGLPTLAEGEPGWVTDEGKVYIGTGAGNIPMAREDHTHTAEQVGALPSSGGRVNGQLVIEFPSTSGPHIVLVDPVWRREIKIKAEAVEGSGEHLDALTFSGILLAGLCDPVNSDDAATKQYVDNAVSFMAVFEEGEPNREFFIDITKPGYVPIQLICANPSCVTNIRIVYSGGRVYAVGRCDDPYLQGYVVYLRSDFRLE